MPSTISRLSNANKMGNAHSRLQKTILFSSLICLASFVYIMEWHKPQLPPPPLAAVATVSSAHLRKSLGLGRDLLELSHTFGFADYRRESDVITLERQIKPHNKTVSDSLHATYQTLSEVRPHARYPLSFVIVDIGGTLAQIHDLLRQVRWFHENQEPSSRDAWARVIFRTQVTRVFSHVIPSDLITLERFLKLSSDHCEIMRHMGATALPVLPSLLQPLGLVRPRFAFSAWAWEQDPATQESIRVYESVEELFEEIEKHCEVLARTASSFRDYWESRDLFRTYEYLSQISPPDMPSVDQLLDTVSAPLDQLEELVSVAEEEKRRILRSL